MAAVLVSVSRLIVGVIVGLTGMGGGALMTPILVLFFDVEPLAAVSSDLMASLVMKPSAPASTCDGHRQPGPGALAVHRLGAGGLLRRAHPATASRGEEIEDRLKICSASPPRWPPPSMIAKNVVDSARPR